MNYFKALDLFFPTGADRASGEVVDIQLLLCQSTYVLSEEYDEEWTWHKEKAWYRNASVNAFHMHRALCREMADREWFKTLHRSAQRTSKKLVAAGIFECYVRNAASGNSLQTFTIGLTSVGRFIVGGRVWQFGLPNDSTRLVPMN